MLTCGDIEQRLDAFVDSQLPPTDLLDVARHAAACPACEERIRRVTVLGHLVGTTVRDAAATLDLSGLWAAVEQRVDAVDHERRRQRWLHPIRGRTVPLWGAGLAVVASAALLLQTRTPVGVGPLARNLRSGAAAPVAQTVGYRPGTPATNRLTGRPMMNEAIVERLHSENVVQVKRLPKDGTTVIWVDYQGEPAR